jgi:hypothetical protein
MFPADILADIQAPLVQSLNKIIVPNGRHSGRISEGNDVSHTLDEPRLLPCWMIFNLLFMAARLAEFPGGLVREAHKMNPPFQAKLFLAGFSWPSFPKVLERHKSRR